jgi:hypothetical protein
LGGKLSDHAGREDRWIMMRPPLPVARETRYNKNQGKVLGDDWRRKMRKKEKG